MALTGRARGARTKLIGLTAALVIVASVATPVTAKNPGFHTSRPAMLTTPVAGGSVTPIITVGDMIGSYRFESIPDGISFVRHGKGTVDVYVNHETSRVPFPLQASGAAVMTTNSNGNQNDFDSSQLSRLLLHQKGMGVLQAEYAIPSSALFQRFCSNFLATSEHGFDRPMLFTNEEGVDWVKTSDPAFIAFPGDADARQIGAVVAYDVESEAYRPIWGMGRLNHENSVAIPGYGNPIVLTTDDTFTTTPSQSQLYSYIADSADDVWNDEGTLWAFVPDLTQPKRSYEDFDFGDTSSISGEFIPVPEQIATGKNPDGSEVMAADVGFPLPPTGTPTPWQQFNLVPIDGPQWVLEYWSQQNNVFDFVRLEDVAYDKRPNMSNVVYLVDSGRGLAGTPTAGTDLSTNGRVWEMVLDPEEPTEVLSLRILIEGDDRPVKDPARIHQPDNIESTPNGLYITEDPGSQQNFPFGSMVPGSTNPPFDPNATNARIWQYKFSAPPASRLSVVAVVDQTQDEAAGVDFDPVSAGTHGFWEASGIIDVSSVFGPGTFLVTIQAHSLWVTPGVNAPDNLIRSGGVWSVGEDGSPDWINKREGGQLVLLKIPGA